MPRKMNHNEKLAHKYKFLREKIIQSYRKGCKIINIVKTVCAVLFILFTLIGVRACRDANDKTVWLIIWIVIIFFLVNIFIITDYCKYLVNSNVIPYLMNDDQLEFGEYAILSDEDFDEEEDDD